MLGWWFKGKRSGKEEQLQGIAISSSLSYKLIFGAIIVALLTLGFGGYLQWASGKRLRQIQGQLQRAMDLEMQAWRTGDEALFESLLDPKAANKVWRWEEIGSFRTLHREDWRGFVTREARLLASRNYRATLEDLELRGDLALVCVRLDDPHTALYDRYLTRFYRRVDDAWLRTSPDPSFWGEEREMKTKHFRFTYRERDAGAIEKVASRIDSLYEELRLALALPLREEKYEVKVFLPERPAFGLRDPYHDIQSPLTFRPTYYSPGEALLRDLSLILIPNLVHQAMGWLPLNNEVEFLTPRGPRLSPEVRNLAWGIEVWWMHQWVPFPSEVEVERREMMCLQLAQGPLSLQAVLAWEFKHTMELDYFPVETVAEYIAEVYGGERFIELLRAVGGKSYGEAISVALGVGQAEFESGWRHFVREVCDLD
jgi:hypothetical protein